MKPKESLADRPRLIALTLGELKAFFLGDSFKTNNFGTSFHMTVYSVALLQHDEGE